VPEANPFAAFGEAEMRTRASLKWQAFEPDVLPLWVAEMDTRQADVITEALQRALARGETGYPSGSDLPAAFAEFAAERWHWTVEPEAALEVADVLTGLTVLIRLLSDPGGPVIITPPVWKPFELIIEAADRTVVPAQLGADGRLDFSTLEEAFDRSTWRDGRAVLLLCSPHNPTGAVHTEGELSRLAELAARYRVRVVVDEVHAPLSYAEHSFLPYLDVPGSESAFAVLSAAKAFNLAGLKAALIIAGAQAREELAQLPQTVRFGASAIGLLAHTTAYRHAGPWLDAHLTGLEENRTLLRDQLEQHLPGVGFRSPEATYFAWLDCRALGLEPDPGTFFLERGRVALSEGEFFGAGAEGFVRLNFAAAPSTLEEAVRRMAAAAATAKEKGHE
jgi:cysteine-S-conjugate beta-lyase